MTKISIPKYTMVYLSILIIMMIGLASAGSPQEPDDYIKLNENISYTKPCVDNGNYCSASTACNITVWYPNQSLFIGNKQMTNNLYYYNYTLKTLGNCDNYCGIYKIDIVCSNGVNNGSRTFYAEVNPTGLKPTDQRTATTGRAIWILSGISILFFVVFIFFQHPAVRYSSITMALIMVVAVINLVFTTLYQEVSDPSIIALFDFISAASYYFYWLGAGIIMIILLVTGLTTLFDRYNKIKLVKYGD